MQKFFSTLRHFRKRVCCELCRLPLPKIRQKKSNLSIAQNQRQRVILKAWIKNLDMSENICIFYSPLILDLSEIFFFDWRESWFPRVLCLVGEEEEAGLSCQLVSLGPCKHITFHLDLSRKGDWLIQFCIGQASFCMSMNGDQWRLVTEKVEENNGWKWWRLSFPLRCVWMETFGKVNVFASGFTVQNANRKKCSRWVHRDPPSSPECHIHAVSCCNINSWIIHSHNMHASISAQAAIFLKN